MAEKKKAAQAAPVEASFADFGLEPCVLKVADLIPYARNSNVHSDEQVAEIAASIKEFGWRQPIAIDQKNVIRAGHGRVLAAQKLGQTEVPCLRGDLTETQWRAYVIADNRLAKKSTTDNEMLRLEMEELRLEGFDVHVTGYSDADLNELLGGEAGGSGGTGTGSGAPEKPTGTLAERFGVPPFSVLNARDGWWQERKRSWIGLGIRSELGRSEDLLGKSSEKSAFGKQVKGKDPVTGELILDDGVGNTSVFDPVLCELLYRWFCPPGGVILDPFAGGSVRGVVASKLGRKYHGCELREEQVEANRDQAAALCDDPEPFWHQGDSRVTLPALQVQADMVMSCPPYADLEKYSDDANDLSNMPYPKFKQAYEEIIAAACAHLKPNSFAAWVVGEVRDRKDENGPYRGFVSDTIAAFQKAGLQFYNWAVLVTPLGALRVTAPKHFETSRKMGKTHQDVLIFLKGDWRPAVERIGPVEFGDVPGEEEAEQEEGPEYVTDL